jgi:hypothetical protein
MVAVTIVVREAGKLKPDYLAEFELPELPRVGDYISIHRPDVRKPLGEDLIVRAVWWGLEHPETHGFASGESKGTLRDLLIECDIAEGPYATEHWLRIVAAARAKGVDVPKFAVSRIVVRDSDLAE